MLKPDPSKFMKIPIPNDQRRSPQADNPRSTNIAQG